MTVFILAGGNDRHTDSEFGDRLARLVKEFVERPVILSCFLSCPEVIQHQRWLEYADWFREKFGDVEILEGLQDNFYDQAERADVIYLHGGKTSELIANLPDFERSREAFDGKIVIGSSAGANYLSSFGVSLAQDLTVIQGSGILRQPVMIHYRAREFDDKIFSAEDWTKAEAKLVDVSDGSNILCIPEGQFAVVVR